MSHQEQIESIVSLVTGWPLKERVTLVSEILRAGERAELMPKDTLKRAAGIAKGPNGPPDDETVKRWIEEGRLSKYGS